MKSNKFNVNHILRSIHRDLGYFVVGITLVYAISGILLNHRGNSNPAAGIKITKQYFPPNLSKEDLELKWSAKKTNPTLNAVVDDKKGYKLYFEGGTGLYNKGDGKLKIEIVYTKPFINFINQLHYNQKKGWTFFADFFAVSLLFLAISGLVIVKGKNGFWKRGIWLVLFGILIVVIFSL